MILCLQATPSDNIGESAGSVAITVRLELRAHKPRPDMVPPVPVVQTMACSLAPKSSQISSAADCRICGIVMLAYEEPTLVSGQMPCLFDDPLGPELGRR